MNVILFTLMGILMLQRSLIVGELFLMINEMFQELSRFARTFFWTLLIIIGISRMS